MLELLYATGIRVSELIELNVDDLNLSAGLLKCTSKNRSRVIPLYTAAIRALAEYLEKIRPQMVEDQAEPALFVNMSGDRMSRQGFWKIIKSYQAKANIDKDITRQPAGTRSRPSAGKRGDLRSIQEMLGHADISSTQIYDRWGQAETEGRLQKSHPRA
jgi:integrase/recombinase XerD